jgi:hypothetical protein
VLCPPPPPPQPPIGQTHKNASKSAKARPPLLDRTRNGRNNNAANSGEAIPERLALELDRETFAVKLDVAPLASVNEASVTEHEAYCGAPEQDNCTGPLNPAAASSLNSGVKRVRIENKTPAVLGSDHHTTIVIGAETIKLLRVRYRQRLKHRRVKERENRRVCADT